MKPKSNAIVRPFFDLVGAAVQNRDATGGIFVFWDCPFEMSELQLMILYLNGQAFDPGFIRQTFWDGPALKHAILFEPEIKVMTPGVMLLHHKSW